MTKEEALRLALEALVGVLDDSPKVLDASISGGLYEVVQCRDAITAIKEALETKDEPVAWMSTNDVGFKKSEFGSTPTVPLYTTPPQRTWVGLTDEEVYAIGFDLNIGGIQTMKAYQAIEAKLKEKNT